MERNRGAPLLLVLFVTAGGTNADSCASPSRLCEVLRPDSVVLLGTVASIEETRLFSTVTLTVDEALWGLDRETRSVKLRDSEHWYKQNEKYIVVAQRDADGGLSIRMCEGIALSMDSPWVSELRQSLRAKAKSVLPVRVVSMPTFAAVERANVTIKGKDDLISGVTDHDGLLTLADIQPGEYVVSAVRNGFVVDSRTTTISILPGACGLLTLKLKAIGLVHGRVVDHLGEPVPNTPGLNLMGWDTTNNKRDYSRSRTFNTNEKGEFTLEGVLPGMYYLGTNLWGQNHPRNCLLPTTIYPGTTEFTRATPILVREDDEIDLMFTLPNFGARRKMTVRVIGEKGEPVPDTLIENGPTPWDDMTFAAVEEKKTDKDGIAEFEIWAAASYSINARWVGERTFRQSRRVIIKPGPGPVDLNITLPER